MEWTGKILFEYSKEANTLRETILEAIKSGCSLSGANMRGANMRGANMRDANMRDANMRDANLKSIKNDLWSKLLVLKNEIPEFKKAMRDGKINGSTYEGPCCCFVGTFANVRRENYKNCPVKPDAGSPIEKWFLAIKEGDTPENSQIAKITMAWI